jgi:hypothetical protein
MPARPHLLIAPEVGADEPDFRSRGSGHTTGTLHPVKIRFYWDLRGVLFRGSFQPANEGLI